MATEQAKGQEVKLEDLPIDQLQRFRKQLEEDVVLSRNNLSTLTTAQERFTNSLEAVKALNEGDQELLIPLSSSMYVRGKTRTAGKVTIDLGTGFFAKVPNEEGQAILKRKIEYIAKNRKAIQEDMMKKMNMIDRIVATVQYKIKEQTTQMAQ